MTIRKAPHNFCKNCGAETSPGQMLCASCSANLSSEAETGADSEEGKSFEISCPHCGETLMGNESIAGVTVECPCCSKKFIVPSAPAESSASQMQETPQPQSGSATSAPVGSQQKPDGRSVGKRRFRITRSQTPNYNRLNTSEKGQPEEQADTTVDTNSEDETGKGHSLSGLFNLLASVLYVAAAALFALHSFAGISLLPELLVFGGKDWTFAAIFFAGVLFDRLARKSSLLVKCICIASMVVCGASYYYERSAVVRHGDMGLRANQLQVGELLVEALSANDDVKLLTRVGKCTEVKIDMDSETYGRNSDGKFGKMFEGSACVELFPRKKGSMKGNSQYKNSPIPVWYDVKVFYDKDKSMIYLEEYQVQGESGKAFLKAAGLTEAELENLGTMLQTKESDDGDKDDSDEGKEDLNEMAKQILKSGLPEYFRDNDLGDVLDVIDITDVTLIKKSGNEYTGLANVKLRAKKHPRSQATFKYDLKGTYDGSQLLLEYKTMESQLDKFIEFATKASE